MEEELVSRTSPGPQGVNDLAWGWPAYWEYILFHHSSYSLWKFLLSSNSKCLMVLLRRHLLQDFHMLSNHPFPSYIHSYDHKRYKHECSISRTVSISLCFYDVGETLIGGIHLDIMLAWDKWFIKGKQARQEEPAAFCLLHSSVFLPVVGTEVHEWFPRIKDVAFICCIAIGNAILLISIAWEFVIDSDRVIILLSFTYRINYTIRSKYRNKSIQF